MINTMNRDVETKYEDSLPKQVTSASIAPKSPEISGVKIVWALNFLWLLIVFLAFITPKLAHEKSPFAPVIYTVFRPTCHQLDSRSLHLCGEKMPMCARCFSIYASLALFGIIFGILSLFKRLPAVNIWVFTISLLPMAIDGGTQALFLRHSTPELRLITGAIAALGVVLFVYPRILDI